MTIHKKGQAHWEGDIKRGKGREGNSIHREWRAEPTAVWI